MKDIDFDELDRAVNSLIAKTPGGSGSDTSAVSNSTYSTNPSSDINSQPVSVPNIMSSASNSLPTVPITTPMPVIERPSTGRFMDVVRPSSDMRMSLVMPERNSNHITNTQPPKPPMVVEVPALPTQVDKPIMPTLPINNYMDKDDDSDIDRISSDIANTLGQTSDQSSNDSPDSPFLSGMKVEKRPLGAFSAGPVSNSAIQPSASLAAMAPTFQSDRASDIADERLADLDTPLPAELQTDLLSIESDTAVVADNPIIDNTLVADKQPIAQAPIAMSSATSPVIATTAPVSTSITPQYKEQSSSGDQNNGAIYDTKTYHKPMANPSKKKSGLKWILWAVILLAIGAGAGVAFYFLVLPHL